MGQGICTKYRQNILLREEILHQFIGILFHDLYTGFFTSQVVQDFFHPQYEHKDWKIGFRDWFHMPLGRDFPTFSYVSWSIVDFQFPCIFEARDISQDDLARDLFACLVTDILGSAGRMMFYFQQPKKQTTCHNLNSNLRRNWDIWWIM